MTSQLQNLFANMGKGKKKARKLKVKEALKLVRDEEAGRQVNKKRRLMSHNKKASKKRRDKK